MNLNSNRKTVAEHASTLLRLLDRDVIYPHEAVFKLLEEVAWDIQQHGSSTQINELMDVIPSLPESAQTELSGFVCGSDDRIFCRNLLCDPGTDAPEDWRHPPTQQRAEVDYSVSPLSIVIHCSDGTSFEIPPDDPYRNVVLAVRNHFDPNLNETRNAG